MKRKTVIFLMVLVACGMAASYVTRLIIAQRGARMDFLDKCLLRHWVDLLGEYPEMQDLPRRADAARRWAKAAADQYSKQSPRRRGMSLSITAADCPAGLTPGQAELIRSVVWNALNAGAVETRDRHEFTWKHALAGQFPVRHKKPSECLDPHFLDQYPFQPLFHETFYPHSIPRPEEVVANRKALEQLANNRNLVELIDECWQIGYQAGCPLADDWDQSSL